MAIFSVVAWIAGVCAFVWLVLIILYCVKKGANDKHVILSAIAYFLLVFGFPLFLQSSLVVWLVFGLIGMLLAIAGTAIAIKKNGFKKSIHAILGLVAMVMYILTVVMLLLVYMKTMSGWTMALVFTALTLLTGGGAAITGTLNSRFRFYSANWKFYIAIGTAIGFTVLGLIAAIMWFVAVKDTPVFGIGDIGKDFGKSSMGKLPEIHKPAGVPEPPPKSPEITPNPADSTLPPDTNSPGETTTEDNGV